MLPDKLVAALGIAGADIGRLQRKGQHLPPDALARVEQQPTLSQCST